MRHPQLPADVAGSDAELGQLHDPQPDGVGQRPPVDKDAAELVHFAVGLLWKEPEERRGARAD